MPINKIKSLSDVWKIGSRVAVAAIAGTMVSGCSFLPKEEPVLAPPLTEPAQLHYKTVAVKKGEIIKSVKGLGVMVPTATYDLHYSKDGGRLQKIHVKKGDKIKKGQVLAEVETGNLAFEIEQARLELKKAEIRLQQMKAEGSPNKYSIQIANLDLQGLNNRLSYLNTQMAESKITSPIDGVVTFVSEIRQGESVYAYQSIFQVAEASQLQIQYKALNAADLADVDVGMEAVLAIDGKELSGEVVQTPKSVPMDLSQKDPDLYGRAIFMNVAELPEGIEIGDMVNFEVITAKKDDTLIIPKNALRSIVGRNFVQLMVDNTKREVDIEVGITSSTQVEVLSGLDEGDTIIIK